MSVVKNWNEAVCRWNIQNKRDLQKLISELTVAISDLSKSQLQRSGFAWNDGLTEDEVHNKTVNSIATCMKISLEFCVAAGIDPDEAWNKRIQITKEKIESRIGRAVHLADSASHQDVYYRCGQQAEEVNNHFVSQGTKKWGIDQAIIELSYQIGCLVAAESKESQAKEIMDIVSPLCWIGRNLNICSSSIWKLGR